VRCFPHSVASHRTERILPTDPGNAGNGAGLFHNVPNYTDGKSWFRRFKDILTFHFALMSFYVSEKGDPALRKICSHQFFAFDCDLFPMLSDPSLLCTCGREVRIPCPFPSSFSHSLRGQHTKVCRPPD